MCYGIASLSAVKSPFIMFYFGLLKTAHKKRSFISEFQFSSFIIKDTSISELLKNPSKYYSNIEYIFMWFTSDTHKMFLKPLYS